MPTPWLCAIKPVVPHGAATLNCIATEAVVATQPALPAGCCTTCKGIGYFQGSCALLDLPNLGLEFGAGSIYSDFRRICSYRSESNLIF